jgi:predicted DNA binding protein
VTAVRDGRLRIESFLPGRTALAEVVDALRTVCGSVSLERLGRVEGTLSEGAGETVTVELAELTETQRETAVLAVDSGYYAQPRETSFAALAAELDVSKSALSQRLRAVESKLTRAAFDRH